MQYMNTYVVSTYIFCTRPLTAQLDGALDDVALLEALATRPPTFWTELVRGKGEVDRRVGRFAFYPSAIFLEPRLAHLPFL